MGARKTADIQQRDYRQLIDAHIATVPAVMRGCVQKLRAQIRDDYPLDDNEVHAFRVMCHLLRSLQIPVQNSSEGRQ